MQKVLGLTPGRRVVDFFFPSRQCHVILEFDILSFSLFLPLKEQTETACLYHTNDTRKTQVTGFGVSSYSGLVWKTRGMVWLTGSSLNILEMKCCRAICFPNTVLRLPMQHRQELYIQLKFSTEINRAIYPARRSNETEENEKSAFTKLYKTLQVIQGRIQEGGCRGYVTCGFLIQLGYFAKKKTMWVIGVEVERETSAPGPKKILDPPLLQYFPLVV